jgi:DNA modification methylase
MYMPYYGSSKSSRMSSQNFKSVYFPDVPSDSGKRQGLTLAFPPSDERIFSAVRHASSADLRQWLGHETYARLEHAARTERRSVNSYCLLRLEQALVRGIIGNGDQASSRRSGAEDPALLATFRGGTDEPLHEWFPYLEGYSPRFVEYVIRTFAPKASRVLDPFSGIGTTPLTAARRGLLAFYCELNPLLQHITVAKIHGHALSVEQRDRAAVWLESAAMNFKAQLAQVERERSLEHDYRNVFGESEFFDAPVFDAILRARSLIDQWRCEFEDFAIFAELAILSTLVPASRLIRRGDLRFKNPTELRRKKTEFASTVVRQMLQIARDLRRIGPVPHSPVLVCEDARMLEQVPCIECDTVITSPPYLNGTNYFRNTKIELWFLRCLHDPDDLAVFRSKAVTAGINDVTVRKLQGGIPPEARDVVDALSRRAYDQRIPAMAANYFADMTTVFDGLALHLRKRAVLAMDIGDSVYGSVHVPTDSILKAVLKARGFRLRSDVTLRCRASRSGRLLRQALLIFQYLPVAARRTRETPQVLEPRWSQRWLRFKNELPHQRGVFFKRNWGHALHSLCSYQGKMKPSLAHFLVKTFTARGETMLDPFAGVGTIPFEAALVGVRTWSFDISPAAIHIARAKLSHVAPANCMREVRRLETYIASEELIDGDVENASAIHFNGALADYFAPETFIEVLKARRFFLEHPPVTPEASLVYACLLHILHGNRPYALSRRSHPITPFAPTGPAEYRPLFPRLRDKVERSLAAEFPDEFVPGAVLHQDACGWWPGEVDNIDAVITSPPFYDSTRFYLANWMRLWFCGWEAQDFRVRPLGFVDERQKKSFAVYEPLFRQARERLKPGGVIVLHLGRSRKCDMAEHLRLLARRWFRVADIFTESVAHCESHGIRDKGTVTAHQFMLLD